MRSYPSVMNKMKLVIAVVEDDEADYLAFKSAIERYGAENHIGFAVDRFSTADMLFTVYKPVYDMIFMDIGLPGTDGFEVSKKLREIDKTVLLIFITNMSRFAVRGYEVGAFDFIVKPIKYGNFKIKLSRAVERLNVDADRKIKIHSQDGLRIVSVSSIAYVEVVNRSLIYHTTDGNIVSYGSLKNVENVLPAKCFARCNSCYLVNLRYVYAVSGYTVTVAGDELAVSRAKKKEFLQALGAYMEGL